VTNGWQIPRHSRPLRLQTKERRDLMPQSATAQTLEIWCGNRSESRNLRVGGRRYFEPCSFTNCAPARHAGAKAVQVLKANSSRWLREHEVDFSWQEGYDAFSVSSSNKHAVMITLNIRQSTIRSDPTKASLRRCCGNRELRSMRRGCSAKVPSLRDSVGPDWLSRHFRAAL
jgi:hypothetical protein